MLRTGGLMLARIDLGDHCQLRPGLRMLSERGLVPTYVRPQTSRVLREAWRHDAWLQRWAENDIATFGLDVVCRRQGVGTPTPRTW